MELNISEKFLLLAHHPEKKRFIVSDIRLKYGLIGAVLLDLSLEEHFEIKNKKVIVKSNSKHSDFVFHELLQAMKNSGKDRKLRYWVRKFSYKARKYKWATLSNMEKKRLLRIEQKKFLGLIPYKTSKLLEHKTRQQLIKEVNKCAFSKKEISNSDMAIMGMVEACKMHKIIASNRDEFKQLRKELKVLIKDSPIAETVNSTIKEVQAAVIAAVVASSGAAAGGR